jgi:hypothetical protein
MDATSRLRARTLFTAVDTMDVAPLDSLFAAGGRVIDDIRTGTMAFYSTIAGPCVTLFHTDAAGKIDDYRVHFDLAPIYA